jgi:hypothetical protein
VLGLFSEEVDVARILTFAESTVGFTVPDASQSSDRHIQFDAPGAADGSVPVVFFQTIQSAGASFSVRLNVGAHLLEATLENTDPHTWVKLGRPGSLMPQHNELVFGVNEGVVTFTDVFILYTANQVTEKKRRVVVATQ